MSLATNVVRRGSIFYFRVGVPARLRALVARAELWRSLRTSHPTTARRRALCLILLTDRLWRDLERLMQLNIERVDRAEVQALIDRWLKAELDEDAYRREAPEGELFAGVVLKSEPPWKPDDYAPEGRPEGDSDETFHAKIVLADGLAAYVGSANLLRRSKGVNLECGMLVEGAAVRSIKVVVDAVISTFS